MGKTGRKVNRLQKPFHCLIEKPLQVYDWVIFTALAAICFFTLQQGDILHTGGSSIAYLNGHILDFYDYNKPYMRVNNYLPSTYILFAIWNIPIRLFNLVTVPTQQVSTKILMWYKLFPSLVYLFCAFLIYQISMEIGFDQKKAKLCAYAFLTTPIGFFSQFIFGQYDILTVCFVLLGLYYYFKNDTVKFVLFFGFAITFKYFALFVFIPLLLLREKKIWRILRDAFCVLIPFIVEVSVYIHSAAFRSGVFGFRATNYILNASIRLSITEVKLFILVWSLLCAWAFFTNSLSSHDEVKWALYFCNLILFPLFGLSIWHPQWLLFMIPFLVMAAFINKRPDVYFLLDILMMIFFIGFTVVTFTHNVDQDMFKLGILGRYVKDRIGAQLIMADLFLIKDKSLWYSGFSAILLVSVIFKHPKFCLENFKENIDKYWGIIRARFLIGIAVFLVPATICYAACFVLPKLGFSVSEQNLAILDAISTDRQVAQVFTATTDTVSRVDVKIGTYARTNQSKLKMMLSEADSGKVLASENLDVPNLVDNDFAAIKFAAVPVRKGQQYRISFVASGTTAADFVTVYRTTTNADEKAGYAFVDGNRQNFNLDIKVYGK